jgi:uncharacterized membrane protein
MKVLSLLPWSDWLALMVFFGLWIGYAWFAKYWGGKRPSVLQTTNRYRRYWMEQSIARDPRMLDGIIVQNLSTSPSFFASTTIIIIGGLLAVMGTTDKAAEFVKELPFSEPTTMLVFDLKMMLLVGIFVYAFFRFSWSLRQYTFVALLIGAMPPAEQFEQGKFNPQSFADRAAQVAGYAAETFNDGLRAYYFAFAAMGWFFSPLIFASGAAIVVVILYRREFQSDVLHALQVD